MDWLTPLQAKCTDQTLKFDIGANDGGYTWSMLQLPGKIVACEPIKQLALQCLKRFADEPRVEVLPYGVSDFNHRQENLAVHEAWTLDTVGNARRGRNTYCRETFGEEPFTVEFRTLDMLTSARTWYPHEKHGAVDFLKIDTDGYEFRVLRGGYATIQKHRPWMLFEFNYMVDDLGESVIDMLDLIYGQLGYVVVEAVNEQWVERDRSWWVDHYPMHTTFDVGLIPAEEIDRWRSVISDARG
jgi:FkbM family methyltransferase